MKRRTIKEIEEAFREIGLTQATWGRPQETQVESEPFRQIFIRIETTTTPLETKKDVDMAWPTERD